MRMIRSKRKYVAAILAGATVAVAALTLVAAGCGSSTPTTTGQTQSTGSTTTAAALSADLSGAGGTFPQPVYTEWIGEFQQKNPGVKINYQGVGSGAGIQQFTKQTVDFGASDAFMKPAELSAAEAARPGAKVLHIPTVFGSIVLAYNLSGVQTLKLDSDTLAKIFLGKITKWNDAAITALNPGVTLPSTAIQTVHRSDSSGTTNAFTSYLTSVSVEWKAGPGTGKTVKWTGGVGGNGNAGVAAIVKQTQGAIGYVEYAYASQNSMTMATMKNKSGNFVAPTLDSTTAAADGITIPADMDLLPLVSNSSNAQAYPIVTGTYILAYTKMPDANKVAALKAFLTWALSDEGSTAAKNLGYAPLPSALKDAAQAEINSIGS
jgi:phosphate transport system substrate-binding protein